MPTDVAIRQSTGHIHPEEGAHRPPPRRVGPLIVMLVAGLAIGRFATFEPDPAPIRTSQRSIAGQMAEMESRLATRPDDLRALQALGALAIKRAAESGDPSFYAVAESSFDRADAISDDVITLLGRGSLALARHEFSDADAIAQRARTLDPNSPDLMGLAVDASVELGRYQEAARVLQEMLDARPALPALARASYLRQLHGDLAGAITAMDQAITAGSGSDHDLAVVLTLRGDLAWIAGDAVTALDFYDRALSISPALVTASVGRARVLGATGAAGEAIDLLAGVIDRFPDPAAVVLRGELLASEGHPGEAGEMFALVSAIRSLQSAAGSVVDLEAAVFEADHGAAAVALAAARRAHAARPDNVFANDTLAWALHRAGDSQAALQFLEQATRLDTADPTIHFHAATILAATGDTDGARRHLDRVAGLNPRFSPALAAEVERLAHQLASR